jgi:hypothetical protein
MCVLSVQYSRDAASESIAEVLYTAMRLSPAVMRLALWRDVAVRVGGGSGGARRGHGLRRLAHVVGAKHRDWLPAVFCMGSRQMSDLRHSDITHHKTSHNHSGSCSRMPLVPVSANKALSMMFVLLDGYRCVMPFVCETSN